MNDATQDTTEPARVEQRRRFLEGLFRDLDAIPGGPRRGFHSGGPFLEVRVIGHRRTLEYEDTAQSFCTNIDLALLAIADAEQNGLNSYVGLHPRSTCGGKDADVLWLTTAAVLDLDHLTRTDGQRDEEKFRGALEFLATLPPPTILIWTGGGLQAIWLLEAPLEATSEKIARREAICRSLQSRINAAGIGKADSVADLSRVFRVAGTTNTPSKRKREKGRIDSPAELLVCNDERYWLDDLEGVLPPVPGSEKRPLTKVDYQTHGDATLPEIVAVILERDDKVRARFERVPRDEEQLKADGSVDQSRVDASLACMLLPRGIPLEDVERALRVSRDRAGLEEKRDGYYARTIGRAVAFRDAPVVVHSPGGAAGRERVEVRR